MSSTKKDAVRKATTSKSSTAKTTIKETDREHKKTKKEEISGITNKTLKTTGSVPKMTKIKQSVSTTSIASPNTRTDKTNTMKGTKTIKKPPTTPPSSRVVKTQFFPTKEMYSNALKARAKEKDTKPEDVAKKTRLNQNINTKHARVESNLKKYPQVRQKNELKDLKSKNMNIKPHINVTGENTSPDISIVSENSERPGTATLTKDKIVNVDKLLKNTDNDEYSYEDDFDSYESDFEAYSSSESSLSTTTTNSSNESENHHKNVLQNTETVNKLKIEDERKLDSGNFDLTDPNKRNCVKEPENNNRSNLTSLSDEGFEENKTSMQFINFVEAQKQCRLQKNIENRRKRGEEILSMIRLDSYSFTLFELTPIPYERYIKLYGATNTMQASSQTGEDEETEETQTEVIEMKNKWTQCPVKFTKIDSSDDYFNKYKREIKGVGDDETNFTNESEETPRLFEFLKLTTQTMLTILEETSQLSSSDLVKTKKLPFSDDFIEFNINCDEFIKNRRVVFVSFATNTNIKILTVHESEQNEVGFNRSVICVWSLSDTNKPKFYLISFGEITCCCFNKSDTSIVFAGMKDGTVSVWDTNETENLHESVPENENKTTYRTPTYITEINSGHTSKVVSVQTITDSLSRTSLGMDFDLKLSTDLCTLDEDGDIFIWDIITEGNFRKPLGLAHWGHVTLVQNSKLSLKEMFSELKNLKCTSMLINDLDPNHIFISTNYGYVIHCLVKGSNANPKKYTTNNANLEMKCLSGCPFSPLYFFGCSAGEISLHSRSNEKPLMIMSNKEDCLESQIEFLEWSYSRPCIFYTKDTKNVLHIWNLAESDIYPMYSIPFKEKILYMKLSPMVVNETSFNRKCFMIIAHEKSLHLHVLNEEHGQQSYDKYQLEVKKFLNYVNIL